jgi:hypothetical protein
LRELKNPISSQTSLLGDFSNVKKICEGLVVDKTMLFFYSVLTGVRRNESTGDESPLVSFIIYTAGRLVVEGINDSGPPESGISSA